MGGKRTEGEGRGKERTGKEGRGQGREEKIGKGGGRGGGQGEGAPLMQVPGSAPGYISLTHRHYRYCGMLTEFNLTVVEIAVTDVGTEAKA